MTGKLWKVSRIQTHCNFTTSLWIWSSFVLDVNFTNCTTLLHDNLKIKHIRGNEKCSSRTVSSKLQPENNKDFDSNKMKKVTRNFLLTLIVLKCFQVSQALIAAMRPSCLSEVNLDIFGIDFSPLHHWHNVSPERKKQFINCTIHQSE